MIQQPDPKHPEQMLARDPDEARFELDDCTGIHVERRTSKAGVVTLTTPDNWLAYDAGAAACQSDWDFALDELCTLPEDVHSWAPTEVARYITTLHERIGLMARVLGSATDEILGRVADATERLATLSERDISVSTTEARQIDPS